MKNSKDTNVWFKPVRWSYLPCTWQGWLTYLPMMLFLIGFFVLYHHTHPLTDTLYLLFPYAVCTIAIMHWLAAHKS